MTKQSRINWIDTIKGIAIIFVVLGHIDWGENPLCIWIYSFHMPLFFALSGMLLFFSNGTKKDSPKSFVLRKLRNILYPYVTFSIISLLYLYVFKKGVYTALVDTIKLFGYGALWFLPTLFFSSLLFFFCYRIYKNEWAFVIFFFLLAILGDNFIKWNSYFFIQRIFLATGYIFLGYWFGRISTKLMNSKYRCALSILGLICFIAGIPLSQINTMTDFRFGDLHNIFYYLPLSIFEVSSLCLFIMNFRPLPVVDSIIRYLGRNSLIIFATHHTLPLIPVSRTIYMSITGGISRYIDDIGICTILLLIETIIIYVINRYLSILICPCWKNWRVVKGGGKKLEN